MTSADSIIQILVNFLVSSLSLLTNHDIPKFLKEDISVMRSQREKLISCYSGVIEKAFIRKEEITYGQFNALESFLETHVTLLGNIDEAILSYKEEINNFKALIQWSRLIILAANILLCAVVALSHIFPQLLPLISYVFIITLSLIIFLLILQLMARKRVKTRAQRCNEIYDMLIRIRRKFTEQIISSNISGVDKASSKEKFDKRGDRDV